VSETGDQYAQVSNVEVEVGGKKIEETDLAAFQVDMQLSEPDMATIRLKNTGHKYSNGGVDHADPVKIKVNDKEIFIGEVVGIEPVYMSGGASTCTIRAFNRLHRLLRGRFSQTFKDMSDQDVAKKIATSCGLSAKCGSTPKITHEHIYQHNQTHLEFLRTRAKRLGFDVWVHDKDLYFDAPKTDKDSGIELVMKDPTAANLLFKFRPRLTSVSSVEKVVVHGWDPIKKEAIVGEAKAASSKLGKDGADKAGKKFGTAISYEVDHPVTTVEEAKAIATAKLADLLMRFVTAEGLAKGNPDLKAGIVVKVTVNPDKADDTFNGKYLLEGVTHTYTHTKPGAEGGGGGYKCAIRGCRDAEKGT